MEFLCRQDERCLFGRVGETGCDRRSRLVESTDFMAIPKCVVVGKIISMKRCTIESYDKSIL